MPPHAEQAQQDELPMESIPPAPAPPMPKATSTAPPTTLAGPSVTPSTFKDFITITATEFHVMAHMF